MAFMAIYSYPYDFSLNYKILIVLYFLNFAIISNVKSICKT